MQRPRRLCETYCKISRFRAYVLQRNSPCFSAPPAPSAKVGSFARHAYPSPHGRPTSGVRSFRWRTVGRPTRPILPFGPNRSRPHRNSARRPQSARLCRDADERPISGGVSSFARRDPSVGLGDRDRATRPSTHDKRGRLFRGRSSHPTPGPHPDALRFHGLNPVARFRLTRWLYALCWSGDDRPGPLIDRAAAWLIANKVLLPGVTVVERLVGRIRDRAMTRLWRHLVASLSDDQRARIAGMFDVGDTSTFAALDALRTVPTKRMPTELYRHLDRLDAIRAFNLRPSPPRGVPAATLERLARVARVGKPSAIAALQEPRRTATIAALFHTLEAAAQDDAAELAEALLADMVKDAEAADKQARLRSLRDLDDAAILLRQMGLLVLTDDALPLDEWRKALFERLPRSNIEAAMSKVDAIAKPAETKPYDELRNRWRRARRLFFDIVTRIETGAAPGGQGVKAAIDYLQAVDDWSSLAKMRGAPTAAIPKAWRQHVLDQDGRMRDPKAYVFAIIEAWRLAIKRRDVFVMPGIRYGDPRRGMLEGESWQNSRLMVARALGRSLEADTEIDGLTGLLDEAYRHVAARAGDNPDLRFETVADKTEIVVTPLDRLDEPESLRALRVAVQTRMPKAGMPDIFLEVMARTGFAKSFTHLSERQATVEHFETSLCAVLVGGACNIGLEPV